MITFDFDNIHLWGHGLSLYISSMVPLELARSAILAGNPEYLEDAASIFFSEVCHDKTGFTAEVTAWMKVQTVAAYHGSRLDDADIDAIRQEGLTVLSAERRRGSPRYYFARGACERIQPLFDPRLRI